MNIKSNIVSATTQKLYQLAKKTNSYSQFNNLFESTNANQFINKVNKLVIDIDCSDYEFGKSLEECRNKVKGDVFELFTVFWLNSFGGDRSLLVQNIKWSTRDMEGIDFFGTNKLGNPVTIQSKFISDFNAEFEANRLETFFGKSTEYTIASDKCPSMLLFTTANNISGRYQKYERDGILHIVDRNKINKFVKNNIGFWKYCKEIASKVFKAPQV
jgi:hypothetical protein